MFLKEKQNAIQKSCMIKYIIKYTQVPQFMEQVIPTVKVRNRWDQCWQPISRNLRPAIVGSQIWKEKSSHANSSFYTGGSVHREMRVFPMATKLLGSSSVAIATHSQSRILSISTVLPTFPWDIDRENLLLTWKSKID